MIKDRSYNSGSYFIFLSGIFIAAFSVAVALSLYWIAAIPFGILIFYLGWQEWRFVFFLLIFSLPWSVEYSFNSSLGTDLPDEPLMLLTSGLFMTRFFFKPSATTPGWKHPLIFLLLIDLGWIIVTVPFSTDWLISLKFLLAKSWYIIAFALAPLLIFKNKKTIGITGIIFLVSMLAITLVALCRHALSGFKFANVNESISPFFRNHVSYSAMLVCTIPLLVAAFRVHKKFRTFILASIILVVVALFFSYARGAWLALITGAVSYGLIRRQKLLFAFITGLIVLLASLTWIIKDDHYLNYATDYRTTIFHKNFEEHLIATYQLKEISTAERFNRWVAGVRMIKDVPVTGYGPNTFYDNYKPYTLPVFRTWVSDNTEHSTVHNYFLLTIIEQGVPGLLFFLLIAGAMLYYSEKLYKRISDQFYKTVAMSCGVMLVMIITVNFLSDLVETDKVGSLFFLCLATLVATDLNTRNEMA